MCSSDDVRQIVREEIGDVFREANEDHAEQHRDILKLVQSNSNSIKAVEENTIELVKLHADAQAVIRVSSKLGKFAKWVAIPIAGVALAYDYVLHAMTHLSIFK